MDRRLSHGIIGSKSATLSGKMDNKQDCLIHRQ